jgi:hypothetical protein
MKCHVYVQNAKSMLHGLQADIASDISVALMLQHNHVVVCADVALDMIGAAGAQVVGR